MKTRAKLCRIAVVLGLMGCGGEELETPADAGADASEVVREELDEGKSLYTGTFSATCTDGDELGAWEFPVQMLFDRQGDRVSGRSWSLPDGTAVALSGSVREGQLSVDGFTLKADGENFFAAIDDVSLVREGETLRGDLRGALEGAYHTDIYTQCAAEGRLELTRDTEAPVATLPAPILGGFGGIFLTFDEAVDARVALRVTNEGTPVAVTVTPVTVADDLVTGLDIAPIGAWPPGALHFELTGTRDASGQSAADVVFERTGRPWLSALLDPSFEGRPGLESPWLRCGNHRGSYVYSVEPFDSENEITVQPSDGAQLAVCDHGGRILEAYVEPPAGAVRLRIDALDPEPPERLAGLTLSLVYGDHTLSLQPELPLSDAPVLHPWSVAIDPAEGPFWLVADYEGYTDENGMAEGVALFDHLRFETAASD